MKLFDMLTNADIKRIKALPTSDKRVKELENSLSIALDLNDTMQRENKKLKDQCMTAGRTLIELNLKYETALADLARAKEDHQYDNMVHQKELNERK